jgi:carbon-monoxide dehydrogenase medium subunit
MVDSDFEDEPQGADYLAPVSIDEALALLAEHGEEAKIIAGGQSLLVFLRQGLLEPRVLIGLKRIPELTRIEVSPDGGLTIGSMVTQHALETSPIVGERFPALAEAAASVASPLIRRLGTIGGNLCHGDPTGDPPAALIALGAEVEIANPGGCRRVPVDELFADYMETHLESGDLLVAVHLPAPTPDSGSAYFKHRIRAVDTALVGAGVGLTLSADGLTCTEARIGLVGAGVTPIRARNAEAELRGKAVSSEAIEAVARAASEECEPLADTEGSEWYRREMVAVFVRRAAERALSRAQGMN